MRTWLMLSLDEMGVNSSREYFMNKIDLHEDKYDCVFIHSIF